MVRINATNYPPKRWKGIQVSKTEIYVQSPISTALTLGVTNLHHFPQTNPNPFSFTSLLVNGHGGEESVPDIQQQTQRVIECQSENLRRVLGKLYKDHYAAQENSAAERIREKEMELVNEQRKSVESKAKETIAMKESEFWKMKARQFDQEIKRLTGELQGIANVRGGVDRTEESCSSSFAPSSLIGDAEAESGVKVACNRCGERTATMMAWPCQHVSACDSCDTIFSTCSVCQAPVIKSVEINL